MKTVLQSRSRPIEVNDDLAVTEEGGQIRVWSGPSCIASNDDHELVKAARWALLVRPGSTVAMLGLGTGNLLRLLHATCHVTVFEREGDLIGWFRGRFPDIRAHFVEGDYHDTLTGLWDVIVDDTGEGDPTITKSDLERHHLLPGGCVLSWGA